MSVPDLRKQTGFWSLSSRKIGEPALLTQYCLHGMSSATETTYALRSRSGVTGQLILHIAANKVPVTETHDCPYSR